MSAAGSVDFCWGQEVSTGSGSDRVVLIARIEVAETLTRSLPLPVLTSFANLAVLLWKVQFLPALEKIFPGVAMLLN